MEYFSNKPAPTVGHRLPMPVTNSSNNNDDEEHKPSINLKRKIEAVAEGVSMSKLQFWTQFLFISIVVINQIELFNNE